MCASPPRAYSKVACAETRYQYVVGTDSYARTTILRPRDTNTLTRAPIHAGGSVDRGERETRTHSDQGRTPPPYERRLRRVYSDFSVARSSVPHRIVDQTRS